MSERLDIVLMARHHDFSRSHIKGLIEAGFVKVNGEVVTKAGAKVDESDQLDVFIPPPVPAVPEPEEIPLDVLHEDGHILVLNKPAGLVVHPAPGHLTGTLVTRFSRTAPTSAASAACRVRASFTASIRTRAA